MMREKKYFYFIVLVMLISGGCTEVTNDEQLINVSGFGWSNTVKEFLAKGADVNARNKDGVTPLMNAAENGDPVTVQLLLDHGALVNMQDDIGQTAIFIAAAQGNGRVVEVLLAAGADIDMCNSDGYSPLLTALIKDHTYVARVLMRAGADVNARTKYGYTPLFRAARGGYTDIVRELIDRGAEIDAREVFEEATPLMYAIDKNRTDIVRILIAAGADVNAENRNGTTPLMLAQNKTAIKNLLLEAGAVQLEKSGQGNDTVYNFVKRMYGKGGVLDNQDRTIAQFERDIKAYAIDQGRAVSENEMDYYRAMYHVVRQEYEMALPFINRFLEKHPENDGAYYDRAWIYGSLGKVEQEIQDYSKAIELNTSNFAAYYNRGVGYAYLKQFGKALADFNRTIELNPNLAKAYMEKAWILAACPDPQWRNGAEAVAAARKAVELTPSWESQEILAAAYAESENFNQAIETQQKVVDILKSQQAPGTTIEASRQRLKLYKAHEPWREM